MPRRRKRREKCHLHGAIESIYETWVHRTEWIIAMPLCREAVSRLERYPVATVCLRLSGYRTTADAREALRAAEGYEFAGRRP